jgi:thiol-disulfide isomerase/thioredoxin
MRRIISNGTGDSRIADLAPPSHLGVLSKGETDNIVPFTSTVDQFKAQVAAEQGLVVANFWAQWCAPCRRLAGMLPQIASENPMIF